MFHRFDRFNRLLCAVGLTLSAAACLAADDGEWHDTELPPATIERVQTAGQAYHKCLDEKVAGLTGAPVDSRRVADQILRDCDAALTPVRQAFEQAKVSPQVSERYIRMKRTQAARNLLRVLMAAEAQHPVK